MTKDEALKLALEAAYLAGFKASGEGYNSEYPFNDHDNKPEDYSVWVEDRNNTLREALAEQPAKFDPSAGTQVSRVWWDGDKLMAQPISLKQFYKEPEQLAQQEELVAWMWKDGTITSDPDRADGTWMPLYTSPTKCTYGTGTLHAADG